METCRNARYLHSEKIVVQLGVAVLARPEIERSGGKFVDDRFGAAVLCQIDSLDIGFAGLATFHANVVEVAGSVDRELLVVLFAAPRTHDAAKLPLGETETTNHGSRATVAHLAQDAERGFAMAVRTQGVGSMARRQRGSGPQQFGVGLEESLGEDCLSSGPGGRDPRGLEQRRPEVRTGRPHLA